MARKLSLVAMLFVTWILLSGKLEPLLLALGLASSVFVVLLTDRLDVVDAEGHPTHIRPWRLLRYWGWLLWEIARSNIEVTRRILDPHLPIRPTVRRVHSRQRSIFGRVTYANSITLTPGTVSIDVDDSGITVHALTPEGIDVLEQGEMDRRVEQLQD